MRLACPISATEAVPASVRIGLQLLGYPTLAAPDGRRASFQPCGAGCGWSQRNAAGWPSAEALAPVAPPQTARIAAAAAATASSSRRDPSIIRSDVSIAVARTAVVVRVVVAAVVLRNPVSGRLGCDLGSRRRDCIPLRAEGTHALAVRLTLALVLDERVERVVVVGHLAASVSALDRSDQGRFRASRNRRLAARDQRRPEGRALSGARALPAPVPPEEVEGVSAGVDEDRAQARLRGRDDGPAATGSEERRWVYHENRRGEHNERGGSDDQLWGQ